MRFARHLSLLAVLGLALPLAAGAAAVSSLQDGSKPAAGQQKPPEKAPPKANGAPDLSGIKVKPAPAKPAPAQGTPPAPEARTPAAPVPSGPSPRLSWEVGKNEHEFGEVVQGQILEHTYEISNGGEGDLVITQTKGSCACTVSQVSVHLPDGTKTAYNYGDPLKPGTKFDVGMRVDTKGKREHVAGQVSIYSNDPRSVVNLTYTATVKAVVECEPMYLNFDRVSPKEVKSGMVVVRSHVIDRFGLKLDPQLSPEVRAKLQPREPDADGRAKEWEVHVEIGPNLPEGMFNRPLKLITDQAIPNGPPTPDGSTPMHEVQSYVMAQVYGMVTAEPPFLSFGLVRPGQILARTVRIANNDPEFVLQAPKVTIEGLQNPKFEYPQCVNVVVRPVEEGKSYDIELTVSDLPDTLNGTFIGKLAIEVGHPSKPRVDVTFTGVCRPDVTKPVPAPVGGKPAPAPGPPGNGK